MASQWYCQIGNEQYGPFSSSELKKLCAEHRLLPENMVRQGESGRWVAASQVQGLFTTAAPSLKQAAPLAPRISDSSLGPQIAPVVRPAAVNPASAKPPPPRAGAPAQTGVAAQAGAAPVGVSAPAQPIPVGVAVGGATAVTATPVASGVSIGIAVNPSAAKRAPAVGDEPPHKKKDNTTLYVTAGLAAALLILGGVGAAYGLGMFSSRPEPKGELAKNESETTPAEEHFDPESAAPSAAREAVESKSEPGAKPNGAQRPPVTADSAKPPAESPTGKPTPVQEKTINAAIANKGWRDVSKVTGITYGTLKVSVASAWYGGAATSAAAEDKDGNSSAAAPGKSPYVYIEVSVSNPKGPGILSYKSWNGAGKTPEETAAVLLDSEGRMCRPIAREQAPDSARRQTAELAPGESLSDVLVFEAPSGEFDSLRLALPYAAVGRTGAIGFQIPRDMVALSKESLTRPSAVPGAVAGSGPPRDPVGGGVGEGIVITRETDRPAPGAGSEKPATSDDPPSIKDIVERDLKKMKQEEIERREAEKKKDAKPEP